jgi:ElaB/YqjD/DUF883 family membrane-anchored ribosome-binding protein
MTASKARTDENIDAFNKLIAAYDRRLEMLRGGFDPESSWARGPLEVDDRAIARLRFRYETTRRDAEDLLQRAGRFVNSNPTVVIGGALTAGFLLGAFLGRKSVR